MVNFEDLNIKQLRKIVKEYNLHYHISNYSKLKKDDLIIEMKKHLIIDENNNIKSVLTPFEQQAPFKRSEISTFSKAYYDIINNPYLKENIDPKQLEFYKKYAKPIRKNKKRDAKIKEFVENFDEIIKEKPIKKVKGEKKEKKEKKEVEEKEIDPQDAIKKLQEMISKKEEDIKFWDKKLKGEEPKKEEKIKYPTEVENYLDTLRGLKDLSIKFYGTKDKPNPNFQEFEKKRLSIMKDLENLDDYKPKDNRLFYNQMKKKYGVKTDNELLSLYRKYDTTHPDVYIREYYPKDFPKYNKLKDEKNYLRRMVENNYGDFKDAQKYLYDTIDKENLIEGKMLGYGNNNGYALHTVLVNKSIPFEQAFAEAQNIIKKKKFFHRETKNQYRFRNIPKQKFEPKSFKSKKVNKDITLVFGQLKPEHMHLEGAGLFDWLKEKASNVVSKVGEFFKPRLDNYNNKSKKTIEQYGNILVKQLFISRTPVGSMLNTLINFVSLGKWEELKKKYAFDKLFHLSLVARLESGKDIILEKNEVVNISPDYKVYKDTESLDIPFTGEMTINKILETARKNVGDKTFFDYDAFSNNCQFFIKYLLEGQGLYSQKAKDFLFQDLKEIYEGLPSYVPYIMKGATRLGNIVNKITGGDKNGDIIMKQDDFIKEHKKLIGLLRQFDDPKLLAEADEQAKELKMMTGVDLTKKLEGGFGNRKFIDTVVNNFGNNFKSWSSTVYKSHPKYSDEYNLYKNISGLSSADDAFEMIDSITPKTASEMYIKDILRSVKSLPTRTLRQRLTYTYDVGIAESKLDLSSKALQRFKKIITYSNNVYFFKVNEGIRPNYVKEVLERELKDALDLYPESERAKDKASEYEMIDRVENPLNRARLETLDRERRIATAMPAGEERSGTLSSLEKREASILGLPEPITRYDTVSSMREKERAEEEKKAKVGADIDAELARMRSGPAGVGLGKKKEKNIQKFLINI